ncbi:hypothetical protein BASA83_004960 [Batrachochytrium salamandrivorans]|nr:hypothetical protein BASA83_004960 [Batrachochytrium salamandrivorans]
MDAIESKRLASASQFRVTLLMDLRPTEAALDADGETGGVHLERALEKRFKLFGSLWEFYFPLVDDISQRNSGRRRCNAWSDLGATLVVPVVASASVTAAAAPYSLFSLSSLPVLISATVATPTARIQTDKTQQQSEQQQSSETPDKTVAAAAAAPKRLCKS